MERIEAFVAELARLDVKIRADAGRLRCSAPSGVLTAELQSRVAARKTELLQFLERAGGGTDVELPALVPVPRSETIPLSFAQQRIRALARLNPASAAYNTSTILRFRGPLELPALEDALDAVQRRHEILRTSFPADRGEPRQRIAAPKRWVLPVIDAVKDMRRLPAERREPEIRRALRAELVRPFDLESGPLWRSMLLRLAADDHVLLLGMHHSIYDGASDDVLVAELERFYRAFRAGEPAVLEPPAIQYADFACWQARLLDSAAGRRQLDYWRRRLGGGVPALRLPVDRPRSASSSREGRSRSFALPAGLARAVIRLARDQQAGTFVTLLAAFCALLHRYGGQEDQLVCSPFAARDRVELERLIGYFNNIVALRIDLGNDPTFADLVGRVRRLALEASEHQNLPFQRVAGLPEVLRTPLTRAMFCYQDVSTRLPDLPEIEASSIDLRRSTADFELALYMQSDGADDLGGVLEYDADLFDEATLITLLERFEALLERVTARPDGRLSALPSWGLAAEQVQAHLTAHPGIEEARVVQPPGASAPVAYLVLDEHAPPDLAEIRRRASSLPAHAVPGSFVPLDRLPLQPDGRVDLEALPAPGTAPAARAGHVAPRTDLERTLARLWKQALWLGDDVGVDDHFAELGGHSLLSVQLIAAVESELGRSLPLRAVSRLSTVEEMARLIEGGEPEDPAPSTTISAGVHRAMLSYTASWDGRRSSPEALIVGRNTTGPRRPLFWCLQRHAELSKLAEYIGDDQPLYGMRSANRVMVKTAENIQALAAHYVTEVLQLQPAGPYLLGGNCQAAQIAFDIAERLRAAGHQVALLVLLEKFVPRPYAGRVALLFGAESDRLPHLRFRNPEIGWRKYYGDGWSLDRVSGRHARFFQEPNIQPLARTVRRRIDETAEPRSRDAPVPAPELQRLPPEAYRAQLEAQAPGEAAPGEVLSIPVGIVNEGSVTWPDTERSGIALVNRWVDDTGAAVVWLDGRAPLPAAVEPGAAIRLELRVTVPRRRGRWFLELDLVDEGVAWFHERGSRLCRIEIDVRRASLAQSGLRAMRRLLPDERER